MIHRVRTTVEYGYCMKKGGSKTLPCKKISGSFFDVTDWLVASQRMNRSYMKVHVHAKKA